MITFPYLQAKPAHSKTRALMMAATVTIVMMSFAATSFAAQADSPTGASREGPASTESPRRLFNPPKPGEVWWMRLGKGYTLCESVYQELQKYRPEELGQCAQSVALSVPGLEQIDGWRELDPREHEDLIKRLMQYDAVGVEAYFGRQPETFEQKKKTEEELQRLFNGFLKGGIQVRVQSIPLFIHPRGNPTITYTQPQTVLQYEYRGDSQVMCPNMPHPLAGSSLHFITSDLSGPDPSVGVSEARYFQSFTRVVKYKGELLLLSGGDNLTFYKRVKTGEMVPFCEIQSQLSK